MFPTPSAIQMKIQHERHQPRDNDSQLVLHKCNRRGKGTRICWTSQMVNIPKNTHSNMKRANKNYEEVDSKYTG